MNMNKEALLDFGKKAAKPAILLGSFVLTLALSAIEKKEQEKAIEEAVNARLNELMEEDDLNEDEETEEDESEDEET